MNNQGVGTLGFLFFGVLSVGFFIAASSMAGGGYFLIAALVFLVIAVLCWVGPANDTGPKMKFPTSQKTSKDLKRW